MKVGGHYIREGTYVYMYTEERSKDAEKERESEKERERECIQRSTTAKYMYLKLYSHKKE